MLHRIRSAFAVFMIAMTLTLPAAAWEEPAHWSAAGEVEAWAAMDALFFRLRDDLVFLDKSQQKVDQPAAYARTLVYTGKLDAIGLDGWRALPAAEQAERAKRAAREIRFVGRVRDRVGEQLQRTRQNQPSGWGINVNDVTVVGDCLQKLRTAVGLDPANPYAWHLYAWLAQAVGDLDRAAQGLAGAEAALSLVPDDQLLRMRRRLALDRAWLARERGDLDGVLEAVARAAALGSDPMQVTLLQGLVAAVRGDQAGAFHAADQLRQVEVLRFPMNYRTSGSAPETHNVAIWRGVPCDFAERWIKALAWLQAGDADMALKTFGHYRLDDIYPVAPYFWNDAGLIYELTGRRAMAEAAWNQARISRPFAPYFPNLETTCDVGRLTGRAGALPVSLGFGTFYTAGSRLARAALLVQALDEARDDAPRQDRAADALDVLALCQALGQYPAQAALLRGAVYQRMGDLKSAVIEVEDAMRVLAAQAATPGYGAVLAELTAAGAAEDGGLLAFFGQGGSSASRWSAPEDPAAELAGLKAAYAAAPSDGNRRALARSLIRGGSVAEGRALVAGRDEAPDLVLVLEADRALGESALALTLAGRLAGGDDPWADAGLWTLAGFICLDAGNADLGRVALERAYELDPGNQGLRNQLKLMKGEL